MAPYGITFIAEWFLAPYPLINLFISKDTAFICHQQT